MAELIVIVLVVALICTAAVAVVAVSHLADAVAIAQDSTDKAIRIAQTSQADALALGRDVFADANLTVRTMQADYGATVAGMMAGQEYLHRRLVDAAVAVRPVDYVHARATDNTAPAESQSGLAEEVAGLLLAMGDDQSMSGLVGADGLG